MIGGKENMEIYSGESKTARKVMTLDLLKLLHHEISKTNWLQDSKQVVWGAFTMAFFGCFRMGELLPQNENSFNKENTSPLERFKIQRTIPHFSPHQNS